MPRLPGEPPKELWADLDPNARREVAGAMGAALGGLQAVDAPGCGVWDAGLSRICLTQQSFQEWALDRVREVFLQSQDTPGVLDDADLIWIERLFDENRDAFQVAPRPTLLHTDYALGNVVVVRDPLWRVTGVFDLQQACFGDPEEDLSRAVSTFASSDLEYARRFVDAYRRGRPLRPGYAQRFRLHMLRDRLVIWHYGRVNHVWFKEDATFRSFARRSVELDVFEDGVPQPDRESVAK